jgi:hypothetical protein
LKSQLLKVDQWWTQELLVFTVSKLTEQSTPAVALLSDTYAVVSNLPQGGSG